MPLKCTPLYIGKPFLGEPSFRETDMGGVFKGAASEQQWQGRPQHAGGRAMEAKPGDVIAAEAGASSARGGTGQASCAVVEVGASEEEHGSVQHSSVQQPGVDAEPATRGGMSSVLAQVKARHACQETPAAAAVSPVSMTSVSPVSMMSLRPVPMLSTVSSVSPVLPVPPVCRYPVCQYHVPSILCLCIIHPPPVHTVHTTHVICPWPRQGKQYTWAMMERDYSQQQLLHGAHTKDGPTGLLCSLPQEPVPAMPTMCLPCAPCASCASCAFHVPSMHLPCAFHALHMTSYAPHASPMSPYVPPCVPCAPWNARQPHTIDGKSLAMHPAMPLAIAPPPLLPRVPSCPSPSDGHPSYCCLSLRPSWATHMGAPHAPPAGPAPHIPLAGPGAGLHTGISCAGYLAQWTL